MAAVVRPGMDLVQHVLCIGVIATPSELAS